MDATGPAHSRIGLQPAYCLMNPLKERLGGRRIVAGDILGFVVEVSQCLRKPPNLH